MTLSPSLSMSFNPSLAVTTVEGLLFNGVPQPVNYTINAYAGPTLVDSPVFGNLQSNLNSGFSVFRLRSDGPSISSVLINPDRTGTSGQWDYLIDSLAINQKIETLALCRSPQPDGFLTVD